MIRRPGHPKLSARPTPSGNHGAHGDQDKAVWFNEYGWNAAPEDLCPEQLIWQRVTSNNRPTTPCEAYARPTGVALGGHLHIWYFRQVGNIASDRPDYYFRMVDPDFTPRQVYLAVQDATQQQREVGQGLYQEMNAATKAVRELGADHKARGRRAIGVAIEYAWRQYHAGLPRPDGGPRDTTRPGRRPGAGDSGWATCGLAAA